MHNQDLMDIDNEFIVQWVQRLFQDAIQKKISDIHIEVYSKTCRIRLRRDGLLYESATLATHLYTRALTRIKIMANLNIAEKRLPQDGRIKLTQPQAIDLRISTCPTLHGEKMVIRVQNTTQLHFDIDTLGFTPEQKKLFLEKLAKPQGLIIVTGPTGSGKTITLYNALHHLNQIEKNISTVEDPIEIELPGINQVNINTSIGLDFAAVLRTLLRQDPDIIMVGEIRDAETARMAAHAAQTGHLVLSTLHCQHAKEALSRLEALGVAPEQMATSLSLILSQRLIRKICTHCHAHTLTGCEYCHLGYSGRIGIFELSTLNNLTQMSLWESGLEKIKQHLTNMPELIRVLGTPPC